MPVVLWLIRGNWLELIKQIISVIKTHLLSNCLIYDIWQQQLVQIINACNWFQLSYQIIDCH